MLARKVRILLYDNHDSFTYNLLHILEAADKTVEVDVFVNSQPIGQRWKEYDKVLLSPGPGLPSASGHLMEFIGEVVGQKPLLGVCLGHQAIIEHFGGKLMNLDRVLHGTSRETQLTVQGDPLFRGLPDRFLTGHYHSWAADPAFFPEILKVTAMGEGGLVMAFRHRELDVAGLQFHPESILTPFGPRILKNWIES